MHAGGIGLGEMLGLGGGGKFQTRELAVEGAHELGEGCLIFLA